ncbi:hypothetical protein EXU57_15385 [Segetibacter sp. 3557_3]|uniref:hypothetical protein n=1 Tax=Segetibacter sp. 3557_3 TaxID=2547429 RepID=UPI001058C992|nr:hypothetical protein [Segetibacter sp. 3557_3]TDH24196.1 hypothetical protein EXU57_15385 [Segetibacter sp. 3557_3]
MDFMKTLVCLLTIPAFSSSYAQDVTQPNQPKPFSIIGSIGTSANFYKSNEGDYTSNERNFTRPPFAWNVYGSMIAKTGEFSMPISLVINQYSKSNLKPYFQMGISPTYKWAKVHLGYRTIPFSPLIFENQSFRGVGIELNPKLFRFAAFYGGLNKAISEFEDSNNYRMPQYSRTGYGVKVGVGSTSNYFDLMYFHAKDDSTTAFAKNNSLPAQENSVVGGAMKITLFKKVVFTADGALSGITRDLSFTSLDIDSSNFNAYDKIVRKSLGNFINVNASSLASFAGQSSLTFNFKGFNSNIGYRRVQPDFRSLGTPYLVNDIELVSWSNYFTIANGKATVNTNLSTQHNNLNKNLLSELQTQLGSISVYTMLDQHTSLNVSYSGYDFRQKGGKLPVKDSFRLEQKSSQFNINPSYNITKGNKLHFVSANVNYSTLKDQNQFSGPLGNTTNLSSSLNYTLSLVNKPYSFSINGIYSNYKQSFSEYTSYGATVGTSAQFLKNRNLNVEGNIGYLINSLDIGSTQRNITYSLSTGYQAKKHAINVFANYVYTPPNLFNARVYGSIPSAVVSRNLASGISYNYYF